MSQTESQCKRMIREMKKRRVTTGQFMAMYIANHTARISDIREMGFEVHKEPVYINGVRTRSFEYWITDVTNDAGVYEDLPN